MNKVKRLDLAQNLNYALKLQFINRIKKRGKINSDEKLRLKDEIDSKEGKSKGGYVADDIKKELKRLKVVKNRDNVWKAHRMIQTMYRMEIDIADMEVAKRYGKK